MPGDRPLTSYKDPGYDPIEAPIERRLGLPAGLLGRIRKRGERSNADQISEAGARTVYQITPQTRAAILKKYGVDAYLGPRQSALAAAHVLKEGLDRNGGREASAVAEYHGGVDRRNWGPRTRAYVGRVTGAAPQEGRQSTFDRVRARRQAEAETGPSITGVYDAYRSGRMSPQEEREFEADVESGAIMLPRGGSLKRVRPPEVPTLPAAVVQAHNSGRMSDGERAQLAADVAAGRARLPQGARLETQGAQGAAEGFGLGVRNVLTGAASVLDVVGGAANAVINALPGEQGLSATPVRDLVDSGADAIGLARPETDTERLIQGITEGATGGIVTAGGAAAAAPLTAGARSAAGTVAQALAAAPVTDTIAGAAGGAGAVIGERQGGTPGAIAGALLGGAAGAGASVAARRVTQRFPRSAIVDESGALTENGREVILRSGADPDEVRQMYARERETASPSRTPEQARGAQARREEVRQRLADPAVRARVAEALDRPSSPNRPAADAPDLEARTAAILDAIGNRPPPDAPPASAAAEPGAPRYDPDPLGDAPDVGAPERFARAEQEGVRLSRGQAEQAFEVQNDENSLRVATGGEAEQARQFFAQQQETLKEAVDRFRRAYGDSSLTPEDRGAQVRQALSDLRDEGAEGVRRLYREAEALGGAELQLQTDGIRDVANDILIDEAVSETVKRSINQEMARYGLIGEAAPTNEAGITKVRLDDGSTVQFRGPVKQLTVANAEDLRQAINRLYDPMRPNLSGQQLKSAIDDAVEDATARAAAGAPEGNVGQAYRRARDAYVAQRKTFKAKDVVQRLIEQKRGTDTDLVLDARVVKEVLGGEPAQTQNLRKVKALLLSSRKPEARAAWKAIQAQGLGDIFALAIDLQTQQISGRRLNSAINKFGVEKLKVLLPADEFNQLMKLRRVVADATIPMSGTTNPSGSFTKLVNFLGKGALRLTAPIPGLGYATEAAAALAGKARDLAATRKTLQGITSYDGRVETGRRLDDEARAFVAQFIEDGQAARLMPSAINIKPPSGGSQENSK